MDTIYIRNLALDALIGTMKHERDQKQPLLLNISFSGDFSKAGKSDDLYDSVNYRDVEEKVIALVENSSFFLLEALAENIAGELLHFDKIEEVTVTIDKKGAALKAESIALSITRKKNN